MMLIAIFLVVMFVYALISGRLEKSIVTAPIVFTAAGLMAVEWLPALGSSQSYMGAFLRVAEIGLVLLLFTDASRTDLKVLKDIRDLPVRLLSTGMLLSILFGGLCALAVFGRLSVWEAGILAAILAPTDAGLGQIIVNSTRVPMKIRQALNVEAGLNDGLSVPFLLFFIALSGTGEGHGGSLPKFLLEQLGFGAGIGLGIGLFGGWLLGVAVQRGWMTISFQQLGLVMLPLFCAVASEAAQASMFIAAFAAGLAVQVGFRHAGAHSVEFAEDWGQLLNLSVFFLFGVLVARDWQHFTWLHLAYAILSLTVVRMVPVAIALAGMRLSRATVLFMGWYGPRGLASIVLGLVFLEQETHLPGETTIRLSVMLTVLLSIFAHGLSAIPGIGLYAKAIGASEASAPEMVNGESATLAQHKLSSDQ